VERYALLGLLEEDKYALGGYIRRASKLSDKRRFREGFDALCEARPWLRANDLEALRLEWRSARKVNEQKDAKKSGRSRKSAELGCECWPSEDVAAWTNVHEKKRRSRVALEARQASTSTTSAPGRSQAARAQHGRTERNSAGRCHDMPKGMDISQGASRPLWQARPAERSHGRDSAGKRVQLHGHSEASMGGIKVIPGTKFQCQFIIGIEEDSNFRVVRRVLGPAGAHKKRINLETGAKLRLRGRGSKFLEGPEKQESHDPLMLCVSASNREAYERTVDLVQEVLEGVYRSA